MSRADFDAWREACSVLRDAVEAGLGVPRERQDLNIVATARILAGPVGGERSARFAALLGQVHAAFAAWQGDDGASRVGEGERWETIGERGYWDTDYDEDGGAEFWVPARAEFRRTRGRPIFTDVDVDVSTYLGPAQIALPEGTDPEVARQVRAMHDDMQSAVFAALTSGARVPYTDAGIAVVREAVQTALAGRGARLAAFDARLDEGARSISISYEASAPAEPGTADTIELRGTIDV